MATTGTIDVNLTAIGGTVNASTGLGAEVIEGVKDQGEIIGLAIGLSIGIGLLIGLVFLVIALIPALIKKVKAFKKA